MELRKMLKVVIRLPGGKATGRNNIVQSIINTCREESILGATVTRCLFGYGEKEYKPRALLQLKDLPVIVEIVDEPLAIKQVLPEIKQLVQDNGLITIEEVYAI